ncbi:putative transporter svop-1 [Bolinopsis microptera]|uniref:putative transporter svop-1 n=1 Tax=Bolinopsis microptera TaxID=2820187 RepID=UPI00307A733B
MLYLSDEEEEEMPERTENDPLVTPGSSITTLNDVAREMSVQEVLDKGKFNVIDVLYIIALGLIAIADSMQACYVAIVIPDLTCLWSLSASQQSVLTSLTFLGTGVGGVFIGPLSDRFGRKTSAMVTTIVLFFTMTLTATSPNFYVFLVFSVTAGICIGGSLTIAFTYWAEVSSTSHRKLGITVITIFWNFGIMVSYGIAYLSLNSIGWKTFSYIMAIPALVPAILLAFLRNHLNISTLLET